MKNLTIKVINNIITMNVNRSLQSAARANVRVAAKMFPFSRVPLGGS